MSDQLGPTIEEILTEVLGPPVKQNSLILAIKLGAAASKGISPKQARALLSKRRRPAKKLPPEVTLENLERAIEALRYQLINLDDDTMAMIETANKIRIGLDRLTPTIEAPDPQPTHRVRRDEMIGDLEALARSVVVTRGWLEQGVKVSGYRGGADPNYAARGVALLAAEEYRSRTGDMPSMPNYQAGPEGSPYSRLLVKFFKRFGFDEGSIWNAGKWAVDEMAKKD